MLRFFALLLVLLAVFVVAPATLPREDRAAAPSTPPSGTVEATRVAAQPTLPATATPPLPRPTLAPTATSIPMDQPELRAVWADAFHDGFKTPQQVDELVTWARAANLNAIFVQVRRRGDAYYLKSFEPATDDPDYQHGFDALQYLIDKAHQGPQRLQVHAWLATLPIWGERDVAPTDPRHAFNQHGLDVDPATTWLMYRDDGVAWAGVPGAGMYYLDPGNPDAARYTTDVYTNLVRNYDVDGIHLDQIRYYEGQPLRWGYNPTSVARFLKQFDRDPASVPDPNDPDWVAWRRDQVTALVRRIFLETRAIKPNVAVTAAVVAWGKGPQTSADWEKQPPFASVLQDWRTWLNEGIVDYLLPMDYYRETGDQASWFDTWTRWQAANVGKRGVALGIGTYLNGADDSMAQLVRARSLGALGIALYSYATPTKDLEGASFADRSAFAQQLRRVFTRPAPVPALPWQTRPAGGSILIESSDQDNAAITLDDVVGLRRSRNADGTGVSGWVDLPQGRYKLSIAHGQPVDIDVQAGKTTVVRYAPGQPMAASPSVTIH